jgi:leucyl aminopeptidase
VQDVGGGIRVGAVKDPFGNRLGFIENRLNNVSGSTFAGSIIGGLFLQRFVTAAQDWLHVDLYGWNPKDRPGRPVGAEPQAVRALYALLVERYG